MTTRELLRRRREEQVSVFAHTRVYRIYRYIAYSSIQFNSIQFNSFIRAGVSRREVVGGIFATEARGGVGGADQAG